MAMWNSATRLLRRTEQCEPALRLGSVAARYAPFSFTYGVLRKKPRSPASWLPASAEQSLPQFFSDCTAPRDADLANLEAVLFLARAPLSSRKLAQLAGLPDGTRARTLLLRLNESYDAAASAFRVEEFAGGYQLLTRPCFAPWLRRMCEVPVEVRLSSPALETLAIVAYRQPVLRAEVEAIRGTQCAELLRQLMDRDLVRIVGRSEELGRPFRYGTTPRFLQVFGLRSLDELPRSGTLRRISNDSSSPADVGSGTVSTGTQHP